MHLLVMVLAILVNANLSDTAPEHAIYISVIEIIHIRESNEAVLTVKVFADDMQDALRNALQSKEAIDGDQLCFKHEQDVTAYFMEHMQVHLNGNPTPSNFHTCEEVGDTYQLKFTLDCPQEWNDLKIQADFLMELFPTQSQMVYITHNGKTVTTRLTAKSKSQTVTFNH